MHAFFVFFLLLRFSRSELVCELSLALTVI